ncbi:MAG: hypothetical protein ACKVK6_14360, partial [bacterium]
MIADFAHELAVPLAIVEQSRQTWPIVDCKIERAEKIRLAQSEPLQIGLDEAVVLSRCSFPFYCIFKNPVALLEGVQTCPRAKAIFWSGFTYALKKRRDPFAATLDFGLAFLAFRAGC